MSAASKSKMISSKEVIALTRISRATLNNYISLNLIPPPTIRRPEKPGGPTKMGYFPEWVVERIENIRQLKAAGVRISAIAAHFIEEAEEPIAVATRPPPEHRYSYLEELAFPAILVNQDWEMVWLNETADELLFKKPALEIVSTKQRNIFELFPAQGLLSHYINWKEILSAFMRLAKRDLDEDFLEYMDRGERIYPLDEIKQMWREVEVSADRPISQQPLVLRSFDGRSTYLTFFATRLREGTLLLFSPENMQLSRTLDLLMGRVGLITTLIPQEVPSLMPLCILAGRLESDLHLRTALPPSEYLELINEIILTSHKCFMEHGGTPGSSVKEAVACFFSSSSESPQAYLFEALLCAQDLQKLIGGLDRRWKYKQTWSNTLRMNIGIHCGNEWLGTIPSPLAFEFTVVGDTLTEAITLSGFSQRGAIWASKKVVENLLPANRQRVEFGIRLGVHQERFVTPSIYSPVRELLSQEELERRDLQGIRNLAVTEIIDIYQ